MKKKISIVLVLVSGLGLLFLLTSKRPQAISHGNAAYAYTEAILKFGPRHPESEGLKKAQAYIAGELAKHGWSTMSQSFQRNTPVGKRTFTNLIARFGVDNLSRIDHLKKLPTKGILAAHLDSKMILEIPNFLGADDAASACALIIELAKTLSRENPELASQLELVFFDGEEAFNENIDLSIGDGLYGSRGYAYTLYNRESKPKFGIVLDMVGHKNLKIAVPGDSPSELSSLLFSKAKELGYGKHFTALKPGYAIIDDHIFLNKAGVPTIDIIGANFSHSDWWHQEGDNIDLISAKSLGISYQVTLAMLRDLLAR